MTKSKIITPDNKTINAALKALRVNVPYYTVTQEGDTVTFQTRNGAVTWQVDVVPLATETSGAHGNSVTRKKPPLRIRCQAITKAGRQCKGKALPGSNPPRCPVHKP